MPGRITTNGMNILGNAAIRGVRRAADMELAAMARCTTRKFVHQYPNESVNPSPTIRLNASTPIGFEDGLPRLLHRWVYFWSMRETIPAQPPAFCVARIASGAKPRTIRKNCSTSLYIALVRPPRSVYTSTIAAETRMDAVEVQPKASWNICPSAYIEIPDEKIVITANMMAFSPRVFSSNRSFKYSGTLRALLPY